MKWLYKWLCKIWIFATTFKCNYWFNFLQINCHFAWSLCCVILPTTSNLARRLNSPDTCCKRCGTSNETEMLALEDCSNAKLALLSCRLFIEVMESETSNGVDWLELTTNSIDKEQFHLFLWWIGGLWNARNKEINGLKKQTVGNLMNSIKSYWNKFRKVNSY